MIKSGWAIQWMIVAAFCVLGAQPGWNQELSFLYGQMSTTDGQDTTFSWQIDYRHTFYRYFAWSTAYINEGHILNHKRDGAAGQLWLRFPLFDTHRLWISFGGGAYRYFDTTLADNGIDSRDLRGFAQIYSAAATYYAPKRLFFRMNYNRIVAARDIDTQTLVFGVGYRLWKTDEEEKKGPAPDASAQTTAHEVMLAGGDSVQNTFQDSKGAATEIEYRQGFATHGDWSVTLMNEDGFKSSSRTELATQLWLTDAYLDQRLTLGLGLGPNFFIDSERPSEAAENTFSNIVGAIVTVSTSWRFGPHWLARANWHRVVSRYQPDSDVFSVGPGYRW